MFVLIKHVFRLVQPPRLLDYESVSGSYIKVLHRTCKSSVQFFPVYQNNTFELPISRTDI